MFKNLKKILDDKGITVKAYAEFLGVSEKTAHNKIQGKTEFLFSEVIKTCTFICPEYRMEYVFAVEKSPQVAFA